MNTIKLNTLGDKVIVRKAAENGGNAGGDTGGSGGGAPSGGDTMKYILTSNLPENALGSIKMFSYMVAGYMETGDFTVLPVLYTLEGYSLTVKALALNPNEKVVMGGAEQKIEDGLKQHENMYGLTIQYITKEEFYNPATYV